VVISDQRAAAFSVIARPLYSCLLLTRRKLNHALASARALAPAVPGIRIEELFEIGEAKGRQLLFVPIPCGSQCFEIAYDLCARLRIQIAAPGLPQNTIYNFAHNAPALQSLHCSIPCWFRQLSALDPTDWVSGQNSLPRAIRKEMGREDQLYACDDGDFGALPSGSGLGRGLPRRCAIAIARPFDTRMASSLRGRTGDARRNRDRSRSPRRRYGILCNQANRRRGFGRGCVSILQLW
jgi:hypothetical protein